MKPNLTGVPASLFFLGRSIGHGPTCPCPACRPYAPSTRTIDETIESTRASLVEHVGSSWSPAQHTRRSR